MTTTDFLTQLLYFSSALNELLEKDIFVLGRWMDCLGVEEELLFCLSIVGGSEERCARAADINGK